MEKILGISIASLILSSSTGFAALTQQQQRACREAADKSIYASDYRDSEFDSADDSNYLYIYGGDSKVCYWDIWVKVKAHANGTCTAGHATKGDRHGDECDDND